MASTGSSAGGMEDFVLLLPTKTGKEGKIQELFSCIKLKKLRKREYKKIAENDGGAMIFIYRLSFFWGYKSDLLVSFKSEKCDHISNARILVDPNVMINQEDDICYTTK